MRKKNYSVVDPYFSKELKINPKLKKILANFNTFTKNLI